VPKVLVKAVRHLQKCLFDLCQLPYTLKQAGVDASQLYEIAQKTMDDGAIGYNTVHVDIDDALMLLKKAYA
jgi:alcohol dehydrogenase class IV